MDSILDILDNTILVQDKAADKYKFNGLFVPRVNNILSAMLHEDYLMTWSNNIGLYQHKKYKDTLEEAADIGSFTHHAIEEYVQSNIYETNIPIPSKNALNGFIEWWKIVNQHEVEVLMQEQELICRYFGGTLDMLVKIDGKIYLVDFKTSNHPSYKHFLQLGAYAYMLKLQDIEIDGCIILMLNKKFKGFNEYILDLSIDDHAVFFNDCINTFLSLVYAYYCRLNIQYTYTDIFGGK